MVKVCQQILLEEANFAWLLEEKIARRHKNLSQTVNEILKNYQYMIRSLEKKARESDILREKLLKSDEKSQDYRAQIVKPDEKTKKIEEFIANCKKAKIEK